MILRVAEPLFSNLKKDGSTLYSMYKSNLKINPSVQNHFSAPLKITSKVQIKRQCDAL